MSKYAYKTEITKFGELKVHFPTLDFTNFTKFDAAKQSARDIAKASLLSHLQFYINQRREIPTADDYPFVAERIELDWQTALRIQLSNFVIKNTKYKSIDDLIERYADQYDQMWSSGALSDLGIRNLFDTSTELDFTDYFTFVMDFGMEVDFKEVKLEFKDND